MRIFVWIVSIVLVVAVLAVALQHFRYLRTRRNVVADRQAVFHSNAAFHVVTVVALDSDQELLSATRSFVSASEAAGGKAIYAGKMAANALVSNQIPKHDWDAFVLVEYPSRQAYDVAAQDAALVAARASFASSYALGMKRSRNANLAIPIVLLGIRVRDILTGTPSRYPFTPGEIPAHLRPDPDPRKPLVDGLLANREFGGEAVVVLNFIKNGSKEEKQANAGYGAAMFSLMAEMGNGPMHMGRAVTLEGDAHFDNVIIVYYPGVQYFADMVRSEFFGGIVGGKQLGDSLSSPSVPLLPHL